MFLFLLVSIIPGAKNGLRRSYLPGQAFRPSHHGYQRAVRSVQFSICTSAKNLPHLSSPLPPPKKKCTGKMLFRDRALNGILNLRKKNLHLTSTYPKSLRNRCQFFPLLSQKRPAVTSDRTLGTNKSYVIFCLEGGGDVETPDPAFIICLVCHNLSVCPCNLLSPPALPG